jgi:crotonobetainyl-CoA:carnitine CoA-transferase CaiB-like acyl-CoA transferase
MEALPLEGLRVIDFSQGVAGPVAAMLLADLGAEVIKVEPKRGDWIRHTGRRVERGMSPIYVSMNRNKRGICLEMKDPRGLRAAQGLARAADVIVESFRPGVMERFGLGCEALRDERPGLIYASVTGYGRSGPYVDYPGADSVIQAMGGIMSLNGEQGGEPLRFGMFMVDVLTGMTAYQGVLAALLAKGRSGRGQRVDVSLLDAIMAFQAPPLTEYLMHGRLPERNGNVNSYVAPSGVFHTRDGYVVLTVLEQQWSNGCKALGLEALERDPRFATNAQRLTNRDALLPIVREKLAERGTEEWLAVLRAHDILCAPINDYAQLVDDPQVRVNDILGTLQHASFGPLPLIRNPVRYGALELRYAAPPLLGEHTRQVLAEVLGYSAAEVDALLAADVAREPSAEEGAEVA